MLLYAPHLVQANVKQIRKDDFNAFACNNGLQAEKNVPNVVHGFRVKKVNRVCIACSLGNSSHHYAMHACASVVVSGVAL